LSVTYSNYAKLVYDQIKFLIVTEIPRFNTAGRFVFRDAPKEKDFGFDDFIRLKIVSDEMESEQTAGHTRRYLFDLCYYKRADVEFRFDEVCDVAEHIQELLTDYRSNASYWHSCLIETINYEPPPMPEGLAYSGFVMRLLISKGKI